MHIRKNGIKNKQHNKKMASQDKLFLFLEEEYDGSVDMTCYVAYDHTEKEYFICGQRLDDLKNKYSIFHFYCKSRKSLLKYLRFIVNAEDSILTYGLFNFNNIFQGREYVDYSVLNSMRSDWNEVAVYNRMEYEHKVMKDLLAVLRDVRY
jgi:hypothetical protein